MDVWLVKGLLLNNFFYTIRSVFIAFVYSHPDTVLTLPPVNVQQNFAASVVYLFLQINTFCYFNVSLDH